MFTVVQQGEGVGAGADGVQAVAQASLQVGGAREACDNGGACSGDGGAFVGAARTHSGGAGRLPAAALMREAALATAESKFRMDSR